MKKALVLSILLAFLITSCATKNAEQVPADVQEKCEAPVFAEGDSWKFVDEGGIQWEETIIRKDKKLDFKQNPNKGMLGFFGFPFGAKKLFPLWVGKKVEGVEIAHTVEGIPLNYNYAYTVLGVVEEKVRGGTFTCYKIEFKVRYSSEEGELYLYYSPESKSIVRSHTDSRMLHTFTN